MARGRVLSDLWKGLAAYELWLHLALRDLHLLYARTIFGPLWLTVGMAVYTAALGMVFGHIFQVDPRQYVPWLCVGIVLWTFVVSYVSEACNAFVTFGPYIQQSGRSLFVYIFYVLVKNLISLAHHLLVVVAVMIYYEIPADNAVWLVVTVPLFILNFFCLGVIVAIVSARFRDIPPIIMNILQVGFFVTPIIYKPEQLGEFARLLNFNPLNQMLALLREPLLAGAVTESTFLLCILNALVTGSLAWFLYAFARHRVPYWV